LVNLYHRAIQFDEKADMKTKVMTSAIGDVVRKTRTDKAISLGALSAKVGVSKGYLSRVEHGKAKPSDAMLQRLSRSLKLDLSELEVLSGKLPKRVREKVYAQPHLAASILRDPEDEYGTLAASAPSDAPHAVGNVARYEVFNADCLQWMRQRNPNSIHAIVTDPPYGLKEFAEEEQSKLRKGSGGIWRIPPKLNGYERSPLPRFTVLDEKDKANLRRFFVEWAALAHRILVPGGHVIIASNPLLSHVLYAAMESAGFEKRGEIIRLVQTLRGGDRPKNAHEEFADVSVMPRSAWEPWGLFRKACEGRVQDNLRKWKTGGLRRISDLQPFVDVIKSSPTQARERKLAPHPSLKPQDLMRQLVRAALPLGEGVVLDPFMGAGSTIAAAQFLGYRSIGLELDPEYFRTAQKAIPRLSIERVHEATTAMPRKQDKRRSKSAVELFA
jgi:DNA modification methylase/transcriptional regulator with XRE-family HTH domain